MTFSCRHVSVCSLLDSLSSNLRESYFGALETSFVFTCLSRCCWADPFGNLWGHSFLCLGASEWSERAWPIEMRGATSNFDRPSSLEFRSSIADRRASNLDLRPSNLEPRTSTLELLTPHSSFELRTYNIFLGPLEWSERAWPIGVRGAFSNFERRAWPVGMRGNANA